MVKNDDSDPIKETSGNGLFDSLHSFEKNDEYEIEKEIKEYEDAYKKISEKRNINNSSNVNDIYARRIQNHNDLNTRDLAFERKFATVVCIIVVVIFFSIVGVILNIWWDFNGDDYKKIQSATALEQVEVEDDYSDLIYARLKSINFVDKGAMPTVYKYGGYDGFYYCKHSINDLRFNTPTSIFEVKYEALPQDDIRLYKAALERRGFTNVGYFEDGEIMLKSIDEKSFLFAIVSESFAIYGAGNGDYNITFDLK